MKINIPQRTPTKASNMPTDHDQIVTWEIGTDPELVEVPETDPKAGSSVPTPSNTALVRPSPDRITDITQLPSIWTMDVEIEWLIEDMIPLGGITLISADSGAGKTWVAYAIGGAVARGVPFAGLAVKQRPVVYLDGENPAAVVKKRLTDLAIPRTENFHIWGGWVGEKAHGPSSPLLMDYVKREKPLLIWDSLIEFHEGDEQSCPRAVCPPFWE